MAVYGGGVTETYDGKIVFCDEAVFLLGEWFSCAGAANEYAVGMAERAELLAYTRENERAFGAFVGANMDAPVYDHAGGEEAAGAYPDWVMRAFALADAAFYDWLTWWRA